MAAAASFLTRAELEKFRWALLEWFAASQRDLPWRRNRDPYRVWISEIMLQQTRVAAVIPYFEKFCERFPDVRALAESEEAEVLRLWSGLGYYSRARNLQAAARQIVGEHGGEFPRTLEGLRSLSGIGQYTSNAILSIAFGEPHAVLDGNVARVLARLVAMHGDLRETANWTALQKTADALLEREQPGAWNQAMMELGATICTPRSPQCLLCPVNEFCAARKRGLQDAIPEKRKKRATVGVLLASAVVVDLRGRCLLLAPPESGKRERDSRRLMAEAADIPTLVSRMWHFPTIATGKSAEKELHRYLAKYFGIDGRVRLELLRKVRHAVTYRAITLVPFLIRLKKLPKIAGARAVGLKDISSLPVSNLTRKIAGVAIAASDRVVTEE
ncbi:MAG TPA: A/G-specific adenine glycosylase [Candidatus Acidoferrum sp.]|jgi:A/G-specific adenine glycosylase